MDRFLNGKAAKWLGKGLNPRRFNKGDVVYFLRRVSGDAKYYVDFGVVLDNYTDGIVVELYRRRDGRLINGIPYKEFSTPTKWEKLPKGWTYSTRLFEVEWDDEENDVEMGLDLRKPEDIKWAIEEGLLIRLAEYDDSVINTEISSKGWRLVRSYSSTPITYITLPWYKVFASYEEANIKLKEYEAELKRQSELSDYDWSVEQMDKVLSRWKALYNITEDKCERVRGELLRMERFEDVEVRTIGGHIDWKYSKNRRWNTIFLED